MATKKYYAVKTGMVTGIFQSWEECKASVTGYPGAEYKGFATMKEASEYLGIPCPEETANAEETGTLSAGSMKSSSLSEKKQPPKIEVPSDTLLVYVDGSYDDAIKKYAFGCVFLLPDGRIYTEFGNGDREQSLQHRNVTGEMLGAMYAVKTAMWNKYPKVEIRYDYEGIEKWVTGEWRSKTELTALYASSMREWSRDIQVTFTKVTAHSNVYYNELADKMAKRGLEEADGVPKVRALEDMKLWNE